MELTRRDLLILGGAAGAASLIGMPARAQKRGGDVIIGTISAPPTTDGQTTSAEVARNISLHWLETLYARDENGNPIPDLAQKCDIAADGKTYTFTLRQGVHFHNGQEMTGQDVKVSMERYAKVGGSAPIMKPVDSIAVPSKYIVRVQLKNPVPGFIDMISSPRAPLGIMPASEGDKDRNKINHIGTGPFQFVEFKPDSHVLLKRFDGYSPNTNYTKRDGFSGRKTVYVNSVMFRHIPEGGARAAALETGEINAVDMLPPPTADRLKNNKNVKIYPVMPWAFQTIMINAGWGPTANIKVRQAVLATLDCEEIMAIAGEGLYRLTHGWQHPGTTYFAGDIGKELYNQKNPAKAKQLLQEAGYKGEEIIFLTDSNYKNHHETAVVASEQLKKAGMNIRLNVTDWPTAFQSRLKTEGWNLWSLGFGIEPYEGPYTVANFFTTDNENRGVQLKGDPELSAANVALENSLKQEDRVKAFARFQKRMFEYVPGIKVGDLGRYQATRSNLVGYAPGRIPRMWDVWFD
ncbi:MAG TPA: ABC transporter substrate-binding protein [Candidatus Methylomirabilis sp.]|nr:ABC transporter substrate-binding protein [Candidatus Methylomirabilis sp.]